MPPVLRREPRLAVPNDRRLMPPLPWRELCMRFRVGGVPIGGKDQFALSPLRRQVDRPLLPDLQAVVVPSRTVDPPGDRQYEEDCGDDERKPSEPPARGPRCDGHGAANSDRAPAPQRHDQPHRRQDTEGDDDRVQRYDEKRDEVLGRPSRPRRFV